MRYRLQQLLEERSDTPQPVSCVRGDDIRIRRDRLQRRRVAAIDIDLGFGFFLLFFFPDQRKLIYGHAGTAAARRRSDFRLTLAVWVSTQLSLQEQRDKRRLKTPLTSFVTEASNAV